MNRLLHNWSLKLISLVLAIFLWLHVRGEVNPTETAEVEVPLKLSPPAGWAFRAGSKLPARVSVTVSGPHLMLRNIKGGALANPLNPLAPVASSVSAGSHIKLSQVALEPRAGDQEVTLNAQTDVPDVEVLGVKPPSVNVVLMRAGKQ